MQVVPYTGELLSCFFHAHILIVKYNNFYNNVHLQKYATQSLYVFIHFLIILLTNKSEASSNSDVSEVLVSGKSTNTKVHKSVN